MQNIRSKGKPFATGLLATLWATDPEGAQRVASACGAAQALSREAQRQAEAVQRSEALIRAIESNNGALKNLREFHEGRDKDRPGPLDGRVGYILVRIVEMTLARWQALLAEEAAAKADPDMNHPFVPAKAGTQCSGIRAGFPLARE